MNKQTADNIHTMQAMVKASSEQSRDTEKPVNLFYIGKCAGLIDAMLLLSDSEELTMSLLPALDACYQNLKNIASLYQEMDRIHQVMKQKLREIDNDG